MTPAIGTLNELLHRYLTTHTKERAVGRAAAGGGTDWLSSAELADRVRALALALKAAGIERGDRVALLSENRWEWAVSDFAILAAGAATVPVHPGLSAGQIAYILKDSGAKAALASTADRTALLMNACGGLPGLGKVIAFEEAAAGDGVTSLAQALDQGRAWGEEHPGRYQADRDAIGPADLASLIYTSGTTGDPKGVMLSHGNFASNITACASVFPFRTSDVCLSFLPLCHVFERTVDYTYYHSGTAVIHVPDLNDVAAAFTRFRPTVFAAVPRLYEKMYARILESVPPSKQGIFRWASRVAADEQRRLSAGRRAGPWLALRRALADRLVFSRIRARLGGRLRFCISGGAPLSADLASFFLGAGVRVLEGYGLTETSPVIASNRYGRPRPGTVGPPVPGVEVRIAADGEILTRGPHVMQGYWNAPDLTAATIDGDGWLATGDIGDLDDEGYLSITDRKKEILVTAQGKNVAPQPLENALKGDPLIAQAAVVGDRRPYLSALVVPDFAVLDRIGPKLGVDGLSRRQQLAHPAVRRAVADAIAEATAGFAHHEQIRAFHLVDREFSMEQDELTPTLKLKRRRIEAHFADAITALYVGHEAPRVVEP